MLISVLVASAFCGTLFCAALVMRGSERLRHGMPRNPAIPPLAVGDRREEDRIRPAVDVTGVPIWVDEHDLLWHEIVCWPARAEPAQAPSTTETG